MFTFLFNFLYHFKRELIKKIEGVDIKALRKLLKSYIMPLFDEDTSNCLIVCQPTKSEAIINDFSQK